MLTSHSCKRGSGGGRGCRHITPPRGSGRGGVTSHHSLHGVGRNGGWHITPPKGVRRRCVCVVGRRIGGGIVTTLILRGSGRGGGGLVVATLLPRIQEEGVVETTLIQRVTVGGGGGGGWLSSQHSTRWGGPHITQGDVSARTMVVVADVHVRGILLIQFYCRIAKRLFLLFHECAHHAQPPGAW